MVKNGSRFEIYFLPNMFENPFNFYFKYRETGKTAETLVPSDAIGKSNIYEYKY